MKTSHYLMIGLLTFVGLFVGSFTVSAQKNIDRIIKELENKGVNVNTVVKRTSRTKRVYLYIKGLSFYSKGGNYARQLQRAFDKDSEKADNVSNSKSQDMAYSTLVFYSGKKRTTYNLYIGGNDINPYVSVDVVVNDQTGDGKDDNSSLFPDWKMNKAVNPYWDENVFQNLNDLKNLTLNDGQLNTLRNFDWSGLDKQMNQMQEQMKNVDKQMKDLLEKNGKQIRDAEKRLRDIDLHPENYDIRETGNGGKIITPKKK
jgi:hypothetical protein